MTDFKEQLSAWLALLLRSSVFYLAVLFIPILWTACLAATSWEKARALNIAEVQANNTVLVYQQHIESIFLDADRSLLLLRLLYEHDRPHFDLKYLTNTAGLTSRTVIGFSIVDSSGYVVARSSEYGGSLPYVGDREDFADLKSGDEDRLQISAVQSGRILGGPVIKLTRRLRGPDGGFAGVIIASIDPKDLVKFFRTAQLGARGAITLRNTDREILASQGLSPNVIGQRISSMLLETALAKGSSGGSYWGGGAIDGVNRLVTFRKSQAAPLILTTAISADEVFAPYYRQRLIYFAATVLLTVLLMAAMAWDTGRLARLDKARQATDEMVERFKSATENMPQGLSMFDENQRLVAYNARYLELYSLSPEVFHLGSTLKELLEKRKRSGTFAQNIEDYLQNITRLRYSSGQAKQSVDTEANGRIIHITTCVKPSGGWVSTHEDVTDRRNAERELLRTKNFLDTIIQNIPMPILIKDAQSRKILLINHAYSSLHSVSAERAVGATVQEIFPETLARQIIADDDDALRDDAQTTCVEVQIDTPDHGARVVLVNRHVVRDTAGRPEYVISLVEDATDRKSSEARINQLAHYDSLTGLMNRSLFRERLEEAIARRKRFETPLAVFIVDLDRFKQVNDAFGHHTGDALLKAVARRICDSIREVDLAARLGGDEFALVVLSGNEDFEAGCETLAARLIEAIGKPYELDGRHVSIGCSIGIALPSGHDEGGDELLRSADLALYKAKNSGRNCFYRYSAELKIEADERNALESDLRQAIRRDELELFYQPVVSSATGRIAAVEALVRWRHPTRGLVMPDQFIPLAEESGLIVHLGEWVMARACRDAKIIPDDVKVAINISPAQFAKSEVVNSITVALANADLAPERLEVEITENVPLRESAQNLEALRRLQKIGVAVALDDFGVGYSSLSYLTSFPFDKVKIDKSFIANAERPEAKAVIMSIVQLAESLQLTTCAEGVDSEARSAEMRGLGIDLCQGYLFGRPAPLSSLHLDRRYTIGRQQAA